MARLQVTCTTKQYPPHSHESITHLGGQGWYSTKQQVIAAIETGANSYYTYVLGKHADVGVINGPNGKYVRTHADGQWNDNLLALPACSR